jgi:hypothetical protein
LQLGNFIVRLLVSAPADEFPYRHAMSPAGVTDALQFAGMCGAAEFVWLRKKGIVVKSTVTPAGVRRMGMLSPVGGSNGGSQALSTSASGEFGVGERIERILGNVVLWTGA